jgi:hypothetical protein
MMEIKRIILTVDIIETVTITVTQQGVVNDAKENCFIFDGEFDVVDGCGVWRGNGRFPAGADDKCGCAAGDKCTGNGRSNGRSNGNPADSNPSNGNPANSNGRIGVRVG